jgi:hypothetical protein
MDFAATDRFFQNARQRLKGTWHGDWRERFDAAHSKPDAADVMRALEAIYTAGLCVVAAGIGHRILTAEADVELAGGLPNADLLDHCVALLQGGGWQSCAPDLDATRASRAKLGVLARAPWQVAAEKLDEAARLGAEQLLKLETDDHSFMSRRIMTFENATLPLSVANLVLAKTKYGDGDWMVLSVALPKGGAALQGAFAQSPFLQANLSSEYHKSHWALFAVESKGIEDNATEFKSVLVDKLTDVQWQQPFWPPRTSLYLEVSIYVHRAH